MEDLRLIKDRLGEVSSNLSRTEALRDSVVQRLRTTEELVIRLEGEVEVLDRVADLFRVLIDREVIDNAETAQDLLTEGLQAVFNDLDIKVRADVDIQRGKVAVDLITIQTQPGGIVTEAPSVDAYGGSVSTIQSVLLRIVVLTRRGLRPLLLLDESLAAVAEQYVPRVGQFLSILAQRLGLDVLAVSHNPTLVDAATSAYRIKNVGGEASFKKIRTGDA